MHVRSACCCLLLIAALTACSGNGPEAVKGEGRTYAPEETVETRLVRLPRWHEAVGTVQAKTDTRVEAQVTGRVLKVLVRPGDRVAKGDPLVELDSRALESRLERARQALASAGSALGQARDGLASARATATKAESTYKRMRRLHEQKVVTAEEMEQAETAHAQARAALGQAGDGVTGAQARVAEASELVQQAEIDLGYATIRAQENGEVARREAEPGDLAFPGKPLLVLQTGGSLRLEAMVREGLIARVRIGDTLPVIVSALEGEGDLRGMVEEIEPLADPVTRSFLVKVGLPPAPGLYPGMFGRLMVPVGETEAVLVPDRAVTRVGQLETVMIRTESGWRNAYVRTGERHGDDIEVLSGLSGGETLGVGGGRS